eukprot:UN27190
MKNILCLHTPHRVPQGTPLTQGFLPALTILLTWSLL